MRMAFKHQKVSFQRKLRRRMKICTHYASSFLLKRWTISPRTRPKKRSLRAVTMHVLSCIILMNSVFCWWIITRLSYSLKLNCFNRKIFVRRRRSHLTIKAIFYHYILCQRTDIKIRIIHTHLVLPWRNKVNTHEIFHGRLSLLKWTHETT